MFDTIGYFKEYYVNSKFIGTTPCELSNRVIGYEGRLNEILKEPIKLGKKTIKKGTEVQTIVYPLNGRISK